MQQTPSAVHVRPVSGGTELALAHAFDTAAFGGVEAYYPLDLYRAFFRRESEMFWLLRHHGEIVGSASLAPFGEAWTDALLRGEASEEDARPEDLDPSSPAPTWYFGGLQLLPERRGQGLGPAFARAILARQDQAGRFAYPLRLIGSAYSQGGESVMRGMGLRPSQAARARGMQIFSLDCASPEQLHAAIAGRRMERRQSVAAR